jgi:P-type Cu+ transporter
LRFTPNQLVTAKSNSHLDHDRGQHTHDHSAMPARRQSNELHLKVEGMTCAGCAAAVQRAIEAKPGVTSAAISVTEGRATVSGDQLDANAIVNAIQSAGYEAEPIDDLPAPSELKSEIELRQAHHERAWRFRAIVGLSVWAPLEILHWVAHVNGWHGAWMGWIMLIGATLVLATAGSGFYRSAWSAAKRRTTNMDTLIAMGATTAFVFSLVVFIAQFFGRMHDQPLYFAESAALLGIISLGHWMEARATARAGSAVRELLELQPDTAEVLEKPNSQSRGTAVARLSDVESIPSAEVKPGDHIRIRPGGRVPVDGVVIEGESNVDESVVTGESAAVRKKTGDHVVAGSMNSTGQLIIEAKVDGRHTTIARIAEMVQRAQSSKADIQRLADRIAAIFVPVVLIIAAITLIGWAIAGDFATGVISTVTVLIISCPCALGLATPMAVMVGAGAASKRGILVKSAMALETAGRATHVIFDKTGTLTAGAPVVTDISTSPFAPGSAGGLTRDEMLRLAAAVEQPSEHPIAKAIVRAAIDRGISVPPVKNFEAIPGEGVRGRVEEHEVVVIRDEQATCRVEIDGETVGTMMVADDVRGDAMAAVERLRAMGLTVMMLSGDRRAVAERIGAELGISHEGIIAEATPHRKVEVVASLSGGAKPQAAPTTTVMVGDGINDAAALAQADLGIAMSSGTNIAIESADVVIPSSRVMAVPETIDIARQSLRTIKQNLFFAFFYNGLAIPAAALGLLGPFGPLIAAAAMGLSDITVIGNAIRLKHRLSR